MSENNADSLFKDLVRREYFTENEYIMARYATSDKALAGICDVKKRNAIRSDIIKNILLSLMARSN